MKRALNKKSLDCAGCSLPQIVGAEALRVLCGTCVLSGKNFPRAEQIALSLGNPSAS
jgi:hypothetical protein